MASRACDHYDAGGAIPNFIVLGLADVNQDPCSWMDLSRCNIWDFFLHALQRFLISIGHDNTNRKMMQTLNLAALERKN